MSNGVNDPHDSLPPVPAPMIGRDGSLRWGHAHRCGGCRKLWTDDFSGCKEPMSALCPACFEHERTVYGILQSRS